MLETYVIKIKVMMITIKIICFVCKKYVNEKISNKVKKI